MFWHNPVCQTLYSDVPTSVFKYPVICMSFSLWVPSTWEWNKTLWLLFWWNVLAVLYCFHVICSTYCCKCYTPWSSGMHRVHVETQRNLMHVLWFSTNMWSIKSFLCVYRDFWSTGVKFSVSWFMISYQLLVWIIYCWCYSYAVSSSLSVFQDACNNVKESIFVEPVSGSWVAHATVCTCSVYNHREK